MENTTINLTDIANTIPLNETPKSYASLVVKVLVLNGNESLLLGCCWMSCGQRPYIMMFPPILVLLLLMELMQKKVTYQRYDYHTWQEHCNSPQCISSF